MQGRRGRHHESTASPQAAFITAVSAALELPISAAHGAALPVGALPLGASSTKHPVAKTKDSKMNARVHWARMHKCAYVRTVRQRFTNLRVDPLDDTMRVERVAAFTPHYRAVVTGHFAVWTAAVKC